MNKGFWKAGHAPTLFAAFLYFDVSFMVWVMLGPLGVQIAKDLALNATQKGLMVATPVLAGAILRPVMGVLVDHLKPKLAGLIGQIIVIAFLLWAWLIGISSYQQVLLLGLGLGFAGAAFAVALPLASRWYPPEHQGAALGIAGAGNSGTVFAALFAPSLAAAFGWPKVFGLALIPVCVAFIVYVLLAKDAPNCPPAKSLADYLKVLRDRDAWWFMFFYFVTFGGFVGLASSLTIYFNDQFGMSAIHAGYFTAACVFAGSLVRPLGGALADRIGGVRTLLSVYVGRPVPGNRQPRHADRLARADRFHPRHVHSGHRQRRGVPTGATTLPQGDRGDDRIGRHGGRGGRLLPRFKPGLS